MATSGRRRVPPLTHLILTSCSRGSSPQRPTTSSPRITTNGEPRRPTFTHVPPGLPYRTRPRPAPPTRRRTSQPIPQRRMPPLAQSRRRLKTHQTDFSVASAITRYKADSLRHSCSEGLDAASPTGGGAPDAPS
eukprot:1786060-Pleurochrysis_carterae.AAC.1